MFTLNIDKETNRILSVCETFNGVELAGGVYVNNLPDEGRINIYDYRYVDEEFVYDPVVVESAVAVQSVENSVETVAKETIEDRVAELEQKVKNLTDLVEQLSSK